MEYHGVLSNCSLPGYAWIAAVGCYCELDFPSIDWFAACSTVWCTLGRLRVWQVSLVADPGAACCLTCRCSHTPVGYWWTLIKLKHGFVGKCWKIGYLSLNPVFFLNSCPDDPPPAPGCRCRRAADASLHRGTWRVYHRGRLWIDSIDLIWLGKSTKTWDHRYRWSRFYGSRMDAFFCSRQCRFWDLPKLDGRIRRRSLFQWW